MEKYNYEINDKDLVVFLKGRIDSNNASLAEENLDSILTGKNDYHIILNAKDLEYISSAGLRVILKLIKTFSDMEIVDVTSEVYEIFDMTGFTELVKVRKAFKKLDITGCKVIGEGAKGIVYRYNKDTIVKVYKRNDVLPIIQNERELAKKAFVLGVPTAISYDVVMVGDSYASVFELLDCESMSTIITNDPSCVKKEAKGFSDLLKKIHNTEVDIEGMTNNISTLYRWLDNSRKRIEDYYFKFKEMIDNIPVLNYMVHGDFHTNNIMVQNDELLLIDMDTVSYGNKIVELAVIDFSYLSMNEIDPNNSLNFLGINKELAKEFYDEFIKNYFDGLSKKAIESNLNKIRLLAFLRILNRMIKGKEKEEHIIIVVREIERLLGIVDNLVLE